MFIAQVMYAEGLVKVLNAILLMRRYETRLAALRLEIYHIEEVQKILQPMAGLVWQLQLLLEEKRRAESALLSKHANYVELLKNCKIQTSEYETKFRLIAADVLRISHSSIKPPAWQAA